MKELRDSICKLIPILMLLISSSAWGVGLKVHEWGTFTSFSGADGKIQEGMHHEEEPLPNFVYGVGATQETGGAQLMGRSGGSPPLPSPCPRLTKVPCSSLLNIAATRNLGSSLPVNPMDAGVTQKMETPVIYFYGDEGQEVEVKVDFPKGIISQYYPKAESYTPSLSNVTSLGPSVFNFKVTLETVNDNSSLPITSPESIWNSARLVKANTIRVDNEREKFIFYRGVGDFGTNINLVDLGGGRVRITNNSKARTTSALLLNSDGVKGIFMRVPHLEAGASVEVKLPLVSNGRPFKGYVRSTKAILIKELMGTGLYMDEAIAMVDTWEKSYFHTPGQRLLYMVPRLETDRILPLSISPKPKELVRTLIGRLEFTTRAEEAEYLELVRNPAEIDVVKVFGRLYEPKLRRLLDIAISKYDMKAEGRIRSLLSRPH